jgi:NTE family protein
MTLSKFQPDSLKAREDKMGLCLSGGGYRATLFHLGSLRRLNEAGVLSRMDTISSVSGGSITNGVLAKVWPTLTLDSNGAFTDFEEKFEKPLREFCSKNIRSYPLIWSRLWPPTSLTAARSLRDTPEKPAPRG